MFGTHSKGYSVLQNKNHSVDEFRQGHEISNWNVISHDGWHLPGTKEPYGTCGLWATTGCLNVTKHVELRADGESHAGKIYIKHFQRCCFKADCKKCYLKWAKREAHKSARRIERYQELSGKQPIHVIVSPPSSAWEKEIKSWRKEVYKIIKKVKVRGGACIYHPFRYNKELNEWYYSPHFHVLCFGWLIDVGKEYAKTGYVIKNLGVRKTIYGTIYYQLTHAGIHKGRHSLVWFGSLSYSKLRMPKEPASDICPVCERALVRIWWVPTDRGPPGVDLEKEF